MIAVCRRLAGTGVSHLVVLILVSLSYAAQAGTIVRVSTTLGDYSIELLDETAPVTVQNFLNYVNRNDFDGTYLHRVIADFVVQGGGYRFEPFIGPIDVPQDPPIVNEFNVSNTRGTVAMAKFENAPNSATNQWFVNLTNNSSLDSTNGGFTVFGTVLGEGMAVLDAIAALQFVSLGSKAPNAPYVGTNYTGPLNFVYINAEVTKRFSSAPHVFENATGKLITSINVDNGSDIISMNFSAVPSSTDVIIQANLQSVIPKRDSIDGIATYSAADKRLRIPVLELHLNGSVSVVSNVVFVLSNPELIQFTLESYDQ